MNSSSEREQKKTIHTLSSNDWNVYCTQWCISSIQQWLDHLLGKHFSCVWPLSERLTLLPLTLPISLCFLSAFHLARTHTHTYARFLLHSLANCFTLRPEFCGKGGVILRSRPSVQICLRVQQDFLICVTNTNAFKFPTAPAPYQPHTL